jgi:hypothetical protein
MSIGQGQPRLRTTRCAVSIVHGQPRLLDFWGSHSDRIHERIIASGL